MGESWHCLVSCEHAGLRLPPPFRVLFQDAKTALASHLGWDRGALPLARALASTLGAPLFFTLVTRLLVDCNRSPRHPRLFSRYTAGLPLETREAILAGHYRPYRQEVAASVDRILRERGRVLHLSVHTFSPVLDGIRRTTDIGLLYDPARPEEARLCSRLRQQLCGSLPWLRIHRNAPYRGTADGLVTSLRRTQGPAYLGVELEVNQRFPMAGGREWRRILSKLPHALATVLECVISRMPNPRPL